MELILHLSTGPVLSTAIRAVNLDTWDIASMSARVEVNVEVNLDILADPTPDRPYLATAALSEEGRAVALWLRGEAEPRYFAHGTEDADAIQAWADTQLEEQFLRMPEALFAVDQIALTAISDGGAHVELEGDLLPFVFPGIVATRALLLWSGDATLPREAVRV